MQGLTASPRQDLTTEQVTELLTGPRVEVTGGLELLDANDVLVEDISDSLEDGEVAHGNYQKIHSTCRLRIAGELDWGSARVRPYMVLSDGSVEARFDLGVYLLATPQKRSGESPVTYEVEGYDKLLLLDTPIGQTYKVDAGDGVLASVIQVVNEALDDPLAHTFITDLHLDSDAPSDRVWPISQENTYLRVINDLLAMKNYRSLWVDWNGWFRSDPYRSPSGQATEWAYDADDEWTSIVGEERSETVDLFDTPNRWVFVRDDPAQDAPAVDDGVYEVLNQSNGPGSIDARGRTITRVVPLDAADQAALEARGDRIAAEDQEIATHLDVATGVNPLHWHFDVVSLLEDGFTRRFVSQSWTLPLNGGDMKHRWRLI